jgi:hypothetical protein
MTCGSPELAAGQLSALGQRSQLERRDVVLVGDDLGDRVRWGDRRGSASTSGSTLAIQLQPLVSATTQPVEPHASATVADTSSFSRMVIS